jgi:hypothetical protein
MREHFSSTAVANIPINTKKTGAEAIRASLDIANNPAWQRFIDEGNNLANDSGHRCGPGQNFDSLDTDTVNRLKRYVNGGDGATDLLRQHSIDFLNYVKNPGGACARYFQTLIDQANEIKGWKTDNLNAQHTQSVKDYQATIAQLNALITERRINKDEKTKELADSQALLQKKQAELSTEQGYLNVTDQLQRDATSNAATLDKYKSSLDNNIKSNGEFISYLNDRIKVTKTISLDNYEELYKSVILQNGILSQTVKEMNQNIVNADREAEKVSAKKDQMHTIYISMSVIYFILIVIFLIFLIFYQRGWSVYFKIFVFATAVIFPFVVSQIEDAIYNIWQYLLAVLSGSVYTYKSISV